ncbi:MAG: nucleotidyltransferase domain-containing protein [Candidatus Ranarchaeia archaeon]
MPKEDSNLEKIILYGSISRAEHTPTSDIDLVLITSDKSITKKVFQRILTGLFLQFGVPITALYFTPTDYHSSIDPLVSAVKKEGIILWKKKEI